MVNLVIFLKFFNPFCPRTSQDQSGLAEVSKTGAFPIYVADLWSQIRCSLLYYRVKGRGLLRKDEMAWFSTPQLDQIAQDREVCPGTFATALVPGQRDTGTQGYTS